MRNNEYRDKLVAEIEKLQIRYDKFFADFPSNQFGMDLKDSIIKWQTLLQEYDRLHPETVQVLNVIVDGLPVVCLYDKVADCTIQLIDGTLNITIE